MAAYEEAEATLLRKYETLNELAETAVAGDNKVRLIAKTRGVARSLQALRTGVFQKPTYQMAMEYTMNVLGKLIDETEDEAFRDGLNEGLRTIKQEYMVEYR